MPVADPAAGLLSRLSQGGYVLLITHANDANTASDRADLAKDGCATREHLSATGRQALEHLDDTLRSHNVTTGRVLTSHDCRCIKTAGILFDQAQPWSVIDAPGQLDRQLTDQRRAALIEAVSRWDSDDNLALVTHQTVIRDTFGINTSPAQLLIIEPLGGEGFRLVGSLRPGTDF